MIRLVVFDLDGTLVDSRHDLADAANCLIEEHGGHTLSQAAIVGMVGDGVDLLVRRVLAAGGVRDVPPGAPARFMEIYGSRLLVHTRLYPGMLEALERASALATLAVLSNKPRAASREILEGLGIARFFSQVYGGDAPFPRKPDPQGLWHLMETAGVTRGEALLVGDSPIDIQTARAAATRICIARYGFGYARVTPDMLAGDDVFVDTPRELPKMLEACRPYAP